MDSSQDKQIIWFQSYVDQCVTFTSWRKIETKICQILKDHVEKKLMDPVNRQILFEMLGNDFVNKNFSTYTNNPAVLENVRSEDRVKKTNEMKLFVSSIIDDTLQKKGSKSDPKLQTDLSAFSEDTENLVDSDLQKMSEKKSKKKQRAELHEKYLIDILSREPSRVDDVLPVFQKEVTLLSDTLRHIIWPFSVDSKEKSKNKKNSDQVTEKFVQLYRQQNESYDGDDYEADDDTSSISACVEKVYKDAKCLKHRNSDQNRKETSTILNVINEYGRTFQNHFVFYAAISAQVLLKENKRNSDEEIGNACMVTEKILRLCAVNNDRAKKIVNKIVQELSETDAELLDHIKKTSSDSQGTENGFGSSTNMDFSQKSGKDLSHFVSGWIISAFVNVLNSNSILFIWDQLFFNRWESKVFHDICLALLGLLKPWFMLTKNRSETEKVFFEEPSLLYLLDIRNALKHIQNKGNFSEVPKMNRNIRYEPKPPKPATPPPPPPKVKTPPPPPPPPPPKPSFIPWVPRNKEATLKNSSLKNKVDVPFDLYIDSVRFVPDNATVVKVTGKILNMYLGRRDRGIKFQAYPELESHWRYPKFQVKQTVNKEGIPMNPDVVLMMRVYTVEKHSKKICVLGSCLFGPFSNKHGKQPSLRIGGHQIRVRHGIPDPDFTIEHMLASHMDDNPVIPGLTILLRILPHEQTYVEAPVYETGYYRSELVRPNESEKKLYEHYTESKDLSTIVRDVAKTQFGMSNASDEGLNQAIQQQLQKEGSDIEDFPYQRYVHYNKDHGMMVLVDKSAGLPIFLEGRYFQCLVQVFPGEDSKVGNGKTQVVNFVTEILELESPQRAPDWSDPPKRVKVAYDDRAFILVSLYGLRPKFDPRQNKILDKDGREPKFNLQHAVAWSAVNCFDKGAVFAGIHQIPLLKGRPDDDLFQKLSYLPLDYICKKFKTQVKVFDSASIEINIWDGRFSNNESPPLPMHRGLLNISPNPGKYIKAAENPRGTTAADLLRNGLSNPSDYGTYKRQIVELLKTVFKDNLDIGLESAGFSALI